MIVVPSAVASQSEASGVGLEQCIVGLPACVTIMTRDKAGGPCRSGNAILSAEVGGRHARSAKLKQTKLMYATLCYITLN